MYGRLEETARNAVKGLAATKGNFLGSYLGRMEDELWRTGYGCAGTRCCRAERGYSFRDLGRRG
jgi:hypothetical protein